MTAADSGRAPFVSARAFYPFYVSQHTRRWNRRLHFIGTTCVLLLLLTALVARRVWPLLALPLAGYGFAWIGHYFIEHNRPATFRHPIYSLLCDFRMYADIWRGRLSG